MAGIFFTLLFTSYLMFFNHGPPEDVLEYNRQHSGSRGRHFVPKGKDHDHRLDEELGKQLDDEEKKALHYWNDFIDRNDFVSIGEIYDNCDEKDRILVGKAILLPDIKWGGFKGVKARTFINTTFESELTGGQFFIEVQYKGTTIFKRDWELCTLDEDYGDERIIYCPFNPGDYSFVRDKKIPYLLPKGRYQTKGWVTDQNGDIILCGYSDFQL